MLLARCLGCEEQRISEIYYLKIRAHRIRIHDLEIGRQMSCPLVKIKRRCYIALCYFYNFIPEQSNRVCRVIKQPINVFIGQTIHVLYD